MNLIIKKRSLILKQVFWFTLLSPLYLIALEALSSGYSPIDGQLLYHFFQTKFLVIPLFLCCAWGIWKARIWASKMFIFYVLVMSIIQIKVYLSYQDKTVLFLLFFYFLAALGMVALWGLEFSRAVYHPGFQYCDLGKKSVYPISASFTLLSEASCASYSGYLSNWDSANCFFVSEEELPAFSSHEFLRLKIILEGFEFIVKGQFVSQYGNALGITLLNEPSHPFESATWNDFYGIMSERGIVHTI